MNDVAPSAALRAPAAALAAPTQPAAAASPEAARHSAAPSRPVVRRPFRVGLWFFCSAMAHFLLLAIPSFILWMVWTSQQASQKQLQDEQAAAREAQQTLKKDLEDLRKEIRTAPDEVLKKIEDVQKGVQGAARPEDVAGLKKLVEKGLNNVSGEIGGVKTLSERMQPEAPYPAPPTNAACDVMVLALNSERLPIKPLLREFDTLRGNLQLRTHFPRYRLAVHVVTTNEWETLVPFTAASIPPSAFRGLLSESNAQERLDDVAVRMASEFPPVPGALKRCVLLVSTECPPPQKLEPWQGVGVDALLIGRTPPAETWQAWQAFCGRHQGRAWTVPTVEGDNAEARARVQFYLRQLTHPLVVLLNS